MFLTEYHLGALPSLEFVAWKKTVQVQATVTATILTVAVCIERDSRRNCIIKTVKIMARSSEFENATRGGVADSSII